MLYQVADEKNAAVAAKSLQFCLTLCNPTDGSPPGSSFPAVLQARTLEWVAISFSNACKWKVKVESLSCVQLLATPWTVAYQAPPSMGFSRQEYWSGVPTPPPDEKNEVLLNVMVWSELYKIQHKAKSSKLPFVFLKTYIYMLIYSKSVYSGQGKCLKDKDRRLIFPYTSFSIFWILYIS